MMACDGGHGYVKCSEQKCRNMEVWYGVSALGSIPTRRSSGSPVRGLFCNTLLGIGVMSQLCSVEAW